MGYQVTDSGIEWEIDLHIMVKWQLNVLLYNEVD